MRLTTAYRPKVKLAYTELVEIKGHEPLLTEEVRQYLRTSGCDSVEEGLELELFIRAVREHAEQYTRIGLVPATRKAVWDHLEGKTEPPFGS